ncbi:MAG: oxidoreductase [Alphaproteobacteria bacterium]|nr:oxidoreductase [Alphaproteobacteria bacterium]MBV9062833.1 oxidoreductase [Alphaproteobacteria bacterium]
MIDRFRAILVRKPADTSTAEVVELGLDELMDGDVTVAVSHSSVNYKDGLAVTGGAPVVRRFPMVPGIDLAGVVEESTSAHFRSGDKILVNGFGLSETHYGGYAQKARLRGEWLIPLPEAFSAAEAMAIGTAGYTAMLSVMALEERGINPASGPILVTGAAGGVGSIAIALLAKLGYRVIASTGRLHEDVYLKELGASEILSRAELSDNPKPLGKERWAGAVDSVGSKTLANVLAGTKYGGAVAACGLAQGMDLPASVAPFILRGVSLLGVESVYAPIKRRLAAWSRLARDLDPEKLAAMSRTISLAEVFGAAEDILAGRVRGRLVVDLSR